MKTGQEHALKTNKLSKKTGILKQSTFTTAAPDENPQEYVWKNGRSQISHNEFIQDIDKATDDFVTYLNKTRFPYSLLGFSAGS